MANGNIESVLGTALLPVTFNGVTHLMTVRILPGLNDSCILGTDFVTQFGLVIDDKVRQLWFSDKPIIKFAFGSKFKDVPDTCSGIAFLSEAERDQLEVFHGWVIPTQPDKLTATKLVEHVIDTQGHPPIKQKNLRMSPKVCDEFVKIAEQLIDQELIERLIECNPVAMVRKGDGSYRLCIDFRKVNEISKKDAYPIPFITEILDKLSVALYISTIDLNKAYYQIPHSEESTPKTAFIIPGRGLYQYRRMPFSLTGAPGTFQRLMDQLITSDMRPYVFAN